MRSIRTSLPLLLAALIALPACAQNTTNVTVSEGIFSGATAGTSAPLYSGKLCLLAVNTQGNPISFTQGGGGLNLKDRAFCQTVTSGELAGSLVVPNPAHTLPANICYAVSVTDASTQQNVPIGTTCSISGSSYVLDTANFGGVLTPVPSGGGAPTAAELEGLFAASPFGIVGATCGANGDGIIVNNGSDGQVICIPGIFASGSGGSHSLTVQDDANDASVVSTASSSSGGTVTAWSGGGYVYAAMNSNGEGSFAANDEDNNTVGLNITTLNFNNVDSGASAGFNVNSGFSFSDASSDLVAAGYELSGSSGEDSVQVGAMYNTLGGQSGGGASAFMGVNFSIGFNCINGTGFGAYDTSGNCVSLTTGGFQIGDLPGNNLTFTPTQVIQYDAVTGQPTVRILDDGSGNGLSMLYSAAGNYVEYTGTYSTPGGTSSCTSSGAQSCITLITDAGTIYLAGYGSL